MVSPTERDVFKVVHDCHASSKQRWIDHDGWLWRLHLELHLLACGGVALLPVLPFRLWPLDLLLRHIAFLSSVYAVRVRSHAHNFTRREATSRSKACTALPGASLFL